ncbi:MAG: aquaporin [Candidatus Malihini olakiniferum]
MVPSCAINPVHDLGPRIDHALLPIKNKGDSNLEYAWAPIVGPLIGGGIGSLSYKFLPFLPNEQLSIH